MFERDDDLERLLAVHERATGTAGGTAAVTGAAGVGKTSLLAALRAGARGAVLTATGHPLETDLAFGVLRQLLAGVRADDVPPRLAPILAASTSDADLPVVAHDVLVHVEALCGPSRTLICLDDAQWADDASLTVISHLARRLEHLHASIVVGVREEPGRQVPLPLAHLLADPDTERVTLGGLSLDGTAAMMAGLGAGPDPVFAIAAQKATGGNPFLIVELVRALDEGAVMPTAEHAGQASTLTSKVLRHAVYVRLSALDPLAVEVARCLSISGPAQIGMVAALTNAAPSRVVAVVDDLVAAGILDCEAPSTFTHPLLRQAIYDDTPPARRRSLHGEVAEVLHADGASPGRIAAQLVHAEPSAQEWVVETLLRAASQALTGGSPSTAAAFATHGLRCAPSGGRRWRLLQVVGRARCMIEGKAESLAPLVEAADLAPDDAARTDVVIEHARSLSQLQEHAAALDVLDAASREIADPRARTQLRIEYVSLARTRPAERSRALAELRQITPPPEGASRDLHLGVLALDRAEAGADAQEAGALAREALTGRLLDAAGFTFTFPLQVLMWCDAVDEAEACWSLVIESAESHGWLMRSTMAHHLRMVLRWRRGDLTGAAADWSALTERAALLEGTPMEARVVSDGALVELDRGNFEIARELAAQARAGSGDGGSDYAIGRIALAAGDIAEAVSRLEAAGRHYVGVGGADCPGFIDWRSQLGLACAARGDTERAYALAAEELALAEAFGAPRALGIAARVAGQLSDGDAALQLLERSEAVLDERVAAVELARSSLALGRHLRRTSRAAAVGPLRRALDVAWRSGARALADDAHAELVAAGVRPRRRVLAGVDSLTPAQRRVAELAAEGLTNRQIAQRLFLTIRTVTTHLTAVYQKLQIEGRDGLRDILDGR